MPIETQARQVRTVSVHLPTIVEVDESEESRPQQDAHGAEKPTEASTSFPRDNLARCCPERSRGAPIAMMFACCCCVGTLAVAGLGAAVYLAMHGAD